LTITGCANPYLPRIKRAAGNETEEPQAADPDVVNPQPDEPKEATKLSASGEEFSLVWNDDASAATYNVYKRVHGDDKWTVLAAKVVSTTLIITTSMLPYGAYEFAVSYVSVDGVESILHTSLDATADPDTGWFLEWAP